MSSKLLIGIVIIVCVLTAGIVVFLIPSGTEDDSISQIIKRDQDTEKVAIKEEFTHEGTIMDLLLMGKPIACSYIQNNTETKVTGSGDVYLDGLNRFRVASLQNMDGEDFDSNIIYTETQMHMWVEGGGRSFATVLPVEKPITTLNEKNDATLNSTIAYENVVYTCSEWEVDESMFTPPSNITFTDMRTLFFPKSSNN